jgi:ABC-type bacteriocin/lantibiotic exporter with double-glycine peptidase domain
LAQIDKDIDAMPMGYDTILTDGGRSLSGGQRQRIALARALVHKPRILVLDEATSDLDALTENAIQRQLRALDSTLIIIAHRLSTIAHANAILVLEEGGVVEQGTHQQLMSLNRVYARLVSAQVSHGTADG